MRHALRLIGFAAALILLFGEANHKYDHVPWARVIDPLVLGLVIIGLLVASTISDIVKIRRKNRK